MGSVPIRILDLDLNFLGEVDDYTSLIFTRRWHKPGEFQIVMESLKHIDILKKDNLIMLGNNPKKVGIIEHFEYLEEDKNKVVIKGPAFKGILNRRITVPPPGIGYDYINDNTETVIKTYVNNNVVNPADIDRKISRLKIAADLKRGVITAYQTRYKQLVDEIEILSNLSGLGWDIYLDFDTFEYVFDVMEGKNRAADQDIIPPVIFSRDFDNILKQKYIDSNLNYRNYGYIGGQGEGVNRQIVNVSNEQYKGLNRREIFIDARDISDGESLTERGKQKLSEYQQINTLEAETINNTFEYEVDWDLGDLVTVQDKKLGLIMHPRIIEVNEVYEESGLKVEPVFGTNIPTVTEKIKKQYNIPII